MYLLFFELFIRGFCLGERTWGFNCHFAPMRSVKTSSGCWSTAVTIAFFGGAGTV
jgi:hypothetical protein